MNYLIFINDKKIDTNNISFAITRQNNDVADITNRNADFTQSIKVPKTANNIKIFEYAGLIGSNSEIQYRKNKAYIVDEDTGLTLVENGSAVLTSIDENEFIINIFSGNFNFFKSIENLTLKQIGLNELNHIKNNQNVINTWLNQQLPYRYIIADYNGKYYTDNNNINIDFQIPSASVNYLWKKIFAFINYQYEGAIFYNEDFLNLYLTFPNEVPKTQPSYELITIQNSKIEQTAFYDNNAYINNFTINLIPYALDNNYIKTINKYAHKVLINGTYIVGISGSVYSPYNSKTYNSIELKLYNDLGIIVLEEIIYSGNTFVFEAKENYYFFISSDAYSQINTLTGSISTNIEKVNGYTASFDEAFKNFKVTDFIKEVLMRFGLTPYPINNTNKVLFLTLDEVFANPIEDWTKKYNGIKNETFILSNYAQNNYIKYKYNDQNENHNDATIKIKNENIKEENTLFVSKIFSPNKKDGENGKIYPIWEKKIKDKNTIEYKELENRFYFLKAERINNVINIGSDFLGQNLQANFFYKENYLNCSWREIVNKYYSNINKILDKTKIVTAYIYLKSFYISQIKMENLIFINQLASYFLINKINNFIPKKLTAVELIKIDFYTKPKFINPNDAFIDIIDFNIANCTIKFNLNHNLEDGQTLFLELFIYNNIISTLMPVSGILQNNNVTFSLNDFNIPKDLYVMAKIKGLTSAFVNFETSNYDIGVFNENCYQAPTIPNNLTLINSIYIQNKKYKLNYDYDTLGEQYEYTVYAEAYVINPITLQNEIIQSGWRLFNSEIKNKISIFGYEKSIEINLLYYNLDIFDINQFSKFRIKINNTYSNEINL